MSQAPNLTRAQASERSATVTVSSYEITIDLTDGAGGPGEKTFRTDTVVTLRRRRRAPSTFIDFVGDGIATATLNGRDARRRQLDQHRRAARWTTWPRRTS